MNIHVEFSRFGICITSIQNFRYLCDTTMIKCTPSFAPLFVLWCLESFFTEYVTLALFKKKNPNTWSVSGNISFFTMNWSHFLINTKHTRVKHVPNYAHSLFAERNIEEIFILIKLEKSGKSHKNMKPFVHLYLMIINCT